MALKDIFLNLFDGYGTGGVGPMVLVLIPIYYSAFQSFRTLLKCLKPRKDIIDIIIYAPPFVIFFMAAFLEFFLNLMIFGSYKSPLELVIMVETSYGLKLHIEVIAVAAITLALMLLYSKVASKISGKKKRLLNFSDMLGIFIATGLIGFGVFSMVTGGIAAHGLPEPVIGLYLYCAYTMVIKSVLLLFDLIWTLLCGKKASEDVGRGDNPLERLLSKVRKANFKNSLITLIAGAFLVCCILPAALEETKTYALNGEDDYSKYNNEFVSLKEPKLQLLSEDYETPKLYTAQGELVSGGQKAYLWYASTEGNTGFYVIAGDEQHGLLLEGRVETLTGTLRTLTSYMRDEMESASALATPIDTPNFYIDCKSVPDYSVYGWVAFVCAAPLCYFFLFLFPAVFPAKSKTIRALYKKYPSLDDIMQTAGFKQIYAQNSKGNTVVITGKYIIWELPKTLEIRSMSDVSSVLSIDPKECMIAIKFSDGHSYFLSFASNKDMDMACSSMNFRWDYPSY